MFRVRHEACLCVLAAAFCAVGAAKAEQFWIAYEGDDYPENRGWERVWGDDNGPYSGGANRSVADGIFTLDSLSNIQICDFYKTQRTIDPVPGEVFVAEWRVRLDPSSDSRDVGVGICRALSPGSAYFYIGPTSMYWGTDPWSGVTIGLEEAVFHSYRFESADMQSFVLTIDDTISLNGYFRDNTTLQYSVGFGDCVQGERSLSQWDYFRYGIVPEPTSVVGLLLACVLPRRRTALGVVGM
jgi:hypothetical protein